MANVYKVMDMIAKESLDIIHEKASFIGTVDRQYDDQFKSGGSQWKKGGTLRVKEPNEFEVTDGAILNIQPITETTQTLTVASRKHVAMDFSSVDLAQSVSSDGAFNELSKNYIEPAASRLISVIESDFLSFATKATANLAGTAGTAMTDLTVPGLARAKLNQAVAPLDSRCVMTDSVTMASIVNGLKSGFQDSAQIKEAMREGFYQRLAMADFYENERMWTMTTGADHTTVTVNDSAIADEDTAIVTSGGTLTAGSVFTYADVYDIHPETKAQYPHLKQFVATAISGSAGSQTVTFSPPLRSTGARQNISALPVTTAAITVVGAASTSYVQGLMYHKNAYQFITGDLPLFADANKCARRMKDGISLRIWQDGDIVNDRLILRMDILYGFAALRPQWGCRMIGSANA